MSQEYTADEMVERAVDHYKDGAIVDNLQAIFWMLRAIYEQNKQKGGN